MTSGLSLVTIGMITVSVRFSRTGGRSSADNGSVISCTCSGATIASLGATLSSTTVSPTITVIGES